MVIVIYNPRVMISLFLSCPKKCFSCPKKCFSCPKKLTYFSLVVLTLFKRIENAVDEAPRWITAAVSLQGIALGF